MSSTRPGEDGPPAPAPSPRSRGWSDETRRRILEAGIAELREQRLRPGVSHIRLTDVTERADVSLAIAYRIWSGSRTRDGLGGQDRFHRDLVAEAFRTMLTDYPSRIEAEGERLLAAAAPLSEMVRITADVLYRSLSDDHTGVGIVLGLYGATLTDPALSAVAAETHTRSVDRFTEVLGWVLEWYGRDMADGLSVRDLVVSITALATGFLVRHGLEPEIATRPAGPAEHEWTLFGYCVWALIDRFTRPAGDPAEPVTPAARPRSAARPL